MNRLGKRGIPSKASKSKEHDEETINELKEAFKIFDTKNTGKSLPIQEKSTPGNSRPS